MYRRFRNSPYMLLLEGPLDRQIPATVKNPHQPLFGSSSNLQPVFHGLEFIVPIRNNNTQIQHAGVNRNANRLMNRPIQRKLPLELCCILFRHHCLLNLPNKEQTTTHLLRSHNHAILNKSCVYSQNALLKNGRSAPLRTTQAACVSSAYSVSDCCIQV